MISKPAAPCHPNVSHPGNQNLWIPPLLRSRQICDLIPGICSNIGRSSRYFCVAPDRDPQDLLHTGVCHFSSTRITVSAISCPITFPFGFTVMIQLRASRSSGFKNRSRSTAYAEASDHPVYEIDACTALFASLSMALSPEHNWSHLQYETPRT